MEASGTSEENLRQLFEAATCAFGLHVRQGSGLWSAYRQFEGNILANMPQDQPEALKKQMERVRKLFLRQLAVPHEGLPATL
eukprot:812042-Pyramimonas_sp.AAC.1